jgi:hypothetical protein
MTNDIFRFVSVRPPQRADMSKAETEDVQTHSPTEEETRLLAELRKARELDDGRRNMKAISKMFIGSAEFVSDLTRLPVPLAAFDDWLTGRGQSLKLNDLTEAVKRIFSHPAKELVFGQEYRTARSHVADSLLAASIAQQGAAGIRPQLLDAMRLFGLLERMAADDPTLNRRSAIQKALTAVVLLPADVFPLPPAKPVASPPSDADEIAKKRREKTIALVNELERLKAAQDEIAAAFDNDVDEPKLASAESVAVLASRPKPSETNDDDDDLGSPDKLQVAPAFLLSSTAAQRLSGGTTEVLKLIGISTSEIDVPNAIGQIEGRIAKVVSKLYTARQPRKIVRIGSTYVPADEFYDRVIVDGNETRTPGPCPPEPLTPTQPSADRAPTGAGTARPVGIADLMVVEQDIQKYEMGEIAHIENVLRGEAKERKHRRTQTTEESLFVETERSEQTERELETTERFELQQESQQVISQDTSKAVGVTVSGSYGPSVDVTLNTDFATNSSREDSKRTATSYARDVTARAASRVQDRTLQRRFRRTVVEIEEINTHTLDNRDQPDHAIGVYRWVDKLYKAQIVNYGRRLMFEFIVPEPAAFMRYALSRPSVEPSSLEMPKPPGYCVDGSSQFEPLKAEDIAPDNYLFWASRYSASDIEPPPPLYITLGEAIAESNLETGVSAKASKEIEVPPGYVAHLATRSAPATQPKSKGTTLLELIIDQNKLAFTKDTDKPVVKIKLSKEIGTVPVSILAANISAYAVNVVVMCRRTPEKYQTWQFKTYNAIMIAYQELKARYDEKLEAAQVQQGVAIRGRNPLLNREIEKTELKKQCLALLTGQHFDLFDAMRRNVAPHGYPELDLEEADAEGRYIQFFEQAFEWVNITYIFYPYFWSLKDEWPALALLDDADPLFGRFLQAGAARVQVPVSPGYENTIACFMASHGVIWDGGDPPQVDDKLYRSIVAEIKEQQNADSGKSEGSLSVTQGNSTVTGTDTDFDEDDVDRRITIEGQRYRIAEVTSSTNLTLTEVYRGSTKTNARYSTGVKYVGAPWEVRIPTSLVILQKDASLPDWTNA